MNSAIDQKYLKLGMGFLGIIHKHFVAIATCLEFDFWPLFHKGSIRDCVIGQQFMSVRCVSDLYER